MNKQVANKYIKPLRQLGMRDVALVGGKNASLGEMLGHLTAAGVSVPDGYATTTTRFSGLSCPQQSARAESAPDLRARMLMIVRQLAAAGKEIRGWITAASLQAPLKRAIIDAYESMSAGIGRRPRGRGPIFGDSGRLAGRLFCRATGNLLKRAMTLMMCSIKSRPSSPRSTTTVPLPIASIKTSLMPSLP